MHMNGGERANTHGTETRESSRSQPGVFFSSRRSEDKNLPERDSLSPHSAASPPLSDRRLTGEE